MFPYQQYWKRQGASLAVRWLKFHISDAKSMSLIASLELRSHIPCGEVKKIFLKNTTGRDQQEMQISVHCDMSECSNTSENKGKVDKNIKLQRINQKQ